MCSLIQRFSLSDHSTTNTNHSSAPGSRDTYRPITERTDKVEKQQHITITVYLISMVCIICNSVYVAFCFFRFVYRIVTRVVHADTSYYSRIYNKYHDTSNQRYNNTDGINNERECNETTCDGVWEIYYRNNNTEKSSFYQYQVKRD